MRQLNEEFTQRLSQPLTTLCKCWEIRPNMSAPIFMADFDEDIEINGNIYKAINANSNVAIETQNHFTPDRGLIVGAFEFDFIKEEDLLTGVYKDAIVNCLVVDWCNTNFWVKLWTGHINDIKINGKIFEIELVGQEEKLNQPIGRKFSKLCDAQLGDKFCKIDVSKFQTMATIGEVIDAARIKISNIGNFNKDDFKHGNIKFLGGKLMNSIFEIDAIFQDQENFIVQITNQFKIKPENGDLIRLVVGCDKQFSTCKTKFQNALNFRGCPFMPGEGIIYAAP